MKSIIHSLHSPTVLCVVDCSSYPSSNLFILPQGVAIETAEWMFSKSSNMLISGWTFLDPLFSQGQKVGLHLDTRGAPQLGQSVTAPPNLQPFFEDMSDSEGPSNFSSLKVTPPPPRPPPTSPDKLPLSSCKLSLFFLHVFFSSFHSIRAESGGVSALRLAHTLHPSLSQTQHLPSHSALQSMSSNMSVSISLLVFLSLPPFSIMASQWATWFCLCFCPFQRLQTFRSEVKSDRSVSQSVSSQLRECIISKRNAMQIPPTAI